MDSTNFQGLTGNVILTTLTDEQVATLLRNVAPKHPALRRIHLKLNNQEEGGIRTEAAISSYDRMHHRHNRS